MLGSVGQSRGPRLGRVHLAQEEPVLGHVPRPALGRLALGHQRLAHLGLHQRDEVVGGDVVARVLREERLIGGHEAIDIAEGLEERIGLGLGGGGIGAPPVAVGVVALPGRVAGADAVPEAPEVEGWCWRTR